MFFCFVFVFLDLMYISICWNLPLFLYPHMYAKKGSTGTYISHCSSLFLFSMQRITRWVSWPKYRHSSTPHRSLPGFREGERKTLRVKQNKVWDVNLFSLFGQENSYVKAIYNSLHADQRNTRTQSAYMRLHTRRHRHTCVCVCEREKGEFLPFFKQSINPQA